MKKHLFLFVLIFCNFFYKTYSNDHSIIKIFNEPYFFNIQINDDIILIGTKNGLYTFDLDLLEIVVKDDNVKGYIDFNGSPTIKENLKPIDVTKFDKSIQDLFTKNFTYSVKLFNHELVVSKGKLFVLERNFYDFYNTGSVRSISKDFVGTYSGIYKNDSLISYPMYSNGFIRQFGEKIFICYDGLVLIEDNISLEITKYFKDRIHHIRDVYEISNKEYLIFGDEGIFKFNLDSMSIESHLLETKHGKFQFVGSKKKPLDIFFHKIYFHDQKKYYQYDLVKNEITPLIEFEKSVVSISDYKNDLEKIVVLFENGNVYKYTKSSIQFITTSDNDAHTVLSDDNYLYIIGDLGLNVFSLANNFLFESVIGDELNRMAFFSEKNILKLGGILGVYEIDLNILEEYLKYFKTRNDTIKKETKTGNLTPILVILLIINVIILIFLFFKKRETNNSKDDIKSKIINYIDDNLNEVSVIGLCDKFDLSINDLYILMDNEKPGKVISKKRIYMVKKMKKERKSTYEIVKSTGFSRSYIDKI